MRHFCEHTWPLVLVCRPRARLRIVGRNPSKSVQALASVPDVEVVGTVPDIRPYIAAAGVVVVPLRTGGGTRLKLYQAMAMGKAVVSTTLGAEGLPVVPGEHLLIADTPEDFAEAVITLLVDRTRRDSLAHAALAIVRGRFRAEMVARQFDRICASVVEQRR